MQSLKPHSLGGLVPRLIGLLLGGVVLGSAPTLAAQPASSCPYPATLAQLTTCHCKGPNSNSQPCDQQVYQFLNRRLSEAYQQIRQQFVAQGKERQAAQFQATQQAWRRYVAAVGRGARQQAHAASVRAKTRLVLQRLAQLRWAHRELFTGALTRRHFFGQWVETGVDTPLVFRFLPGSQGDDLYTARRGEHRNRAEFYLRDGRLELTGSGLAAPGRPVLPPATTGPLRYFIAHRSGPGGADQLYLLFLSAKGKVQRSFVRVAGPDATAGGRE